KSVAGTLRLDLAQYRELEAFSKFGSDLDKATQAQLTRGERMVEILKQNQYTPMDIEKQIVILYAGTKGHLDEIPVDRVHEFETELFNYLDANNAAELKAIRDEGLISDETETKLNEAVTAFKSGFTV
ncbi:MAG TPA: F0F1 ATP synthase subunit alpha, partial [Candidatus Marinimicrobia bacterium]|nr:F0F1 ATP synthase subunit alpha [Candidatus Neomarinimicrobiota bacterium]